MNALLLALLLAGPVLAEPVPEVVVVASALREAALATVPASITVLDTATIETAAVQHFEELTPLIPNLNWSGEGSRARYFQLRGTGELEQYEGAPNPSVGFIVDDIDVSDLGGVATSFDVGRIEVLRGPQGTRYGANALAGLIYVQTAEPTVEPGAELTATGGSDDARGIGGVARGTVAGTGESLTYRVAVQRYQSDGFRQNAFLGRDDTSGQDELTARAKLRWTTGVATLQLTVFHVNLDNGYDDFAIDNGFTTYSDKPGEDSQQTNAAALRGTLPFGTLAELVSITGVARSDSVYGFDADWGNAAFWSPFLYDFTQRFDRQRTTVNQEFRLLSGPDGRLFGADWVLGAYALALGETATRRDLGTCGESACGFAFTLDETVSSDYDARSVALFGEVSLPLGPHTTLTAGLRGERRSADYADTAGSRFAPQDRLDGGDLSLTWAATETATGWARLARGYKAGGFNPSLAARLLGPDPPCGNDELIVTPDQIPFAPESLWNLEAGIRLQPPQGRWTVAATAFTQRRNDLQIKVPVQACQFDPTTFLFFTDNAEEGTTTGLELEAGWQPLQPLELGIALGLLDTEITRFRARPELEGRPLAHAPRYNFAVNGTWRMAAGWFARVDYTGKGSYAIDYCQAADCNDPRTRAYQLLGLRAGRDWGAWSVEAWCRNVLDERYAVRGFFFGNEPPAFAPTLYTRLGDPRQAGVTVKYRL